MKGLRKIKEVYFIGIGGIGMSAVARYFKRKNKSVRGYDRNPSPLTRQLEEEGMEIHYEANPALMGNPDLIVYTPAIPEDFPELVEARKSGIELLKRSEVLEKITKEHNSIAIAGTHGKTSISTMLAHILHQSQLGCTAFLGGISANYDTNFLYSEKKVPSVLEADEFDRSFHRLKPNMALISSVDPDHLDIYENEEAMVAAYQEFADLIDEDGVCFIHHSLKNKIRSGARNFYYSLEGGGGFFAENIELKNGIYHFDLHTNTVPVKNLQLGMPGLHNVENAVAASAIAIEAGVSELELRKGLKSFKGIKRRFEFILKTRSCTFIDDYAHHPEEIKTVYNSVKALYPKKKITCIFQPHLFSRTRDHMEAFAEVLGKFDEVVLLDIYPAREKAIKGVNSSVLLEKIKLKKKQVLSKEACVDYFKENKAELLISIGAGDIAQIVPKLKEVLK